MQFRSVMYRETGERSSSPVFHFIALMAKTNGEDLPAAFLKILHI